MQKARRHHAEARLRPLVSVRFQVLFHPLIQGTFHLSLTVLVHYRSLIRIQPYQMVLVDSHKISHVSRYSGYCQVQNTFHIQDYHPLWSNFPIDSIMYLKSTSQSYNPNIAETILVWAFSRSLAATQEITIVFFSSGYLDVSVPRVDPTYVVTYLQYAGLSHSDIYGSLVVCTSPQLFAAYHVLRSLQKPRHPPYALICFLFLKVFLLLS